MAEQRNAGRRVISKADADAIAAKSGVARLVRAVVKRDPLATRREFLAIAMAASSALLTAGGLLFITSPDPKDDPLLGPLLGFTANVDPTTGDKTYPVAGGFAYPRIKANTFGGKFTLDAKASSFKVDDPPQLNADGKFFVVKVVPESNVKPAPYEGVVNSENIMAIYQVCVHLGCLVPYIPSETRFICPCHGSTYERNSQYVRGPAPRNLDQFPVKVVNDTIMVDTGKRQFGQVHA
jgi:cytochrome b6-f complex iron-sulfur subunit